MPHWGEFFIFWKWLHSGIQEYFASSNIFFLGASCHLILRKPRQGYTFLLLSYCSFPINFWASRPKALFWDIGCQLGNSEDNCCCQVLRKSGPFSTLSVPPKLLRENLAHDSKWQAQYSWKVNTVEIRSCQKGGYLSFTRCPYCYILHPVQNDSSNFIICNPKTGRKWR